MARTPTASKRQSLVSVAGLVGHWAVKTGGEVAAPVTQAWDGGDEFPEQLAGPASTSNIVVSRPWKNQRDKDIRERLLPKVGSWNTTVSDQPTDANLIPHGKPLVWPDALLIRMNAPDVDASSGDAKVFELEFAVSRSR